VTVLWRLDGSATTPSGSAATSLGEGGSGLSGRAAFSDVPAGAYYAQAVAWAAANGVVLGVSESEFAPEAAVTREQMAAILYRYANHKVYATSARGALSQFKDAGSISGYAKDAVSWAVGAGLIVGRTETAVEPAGTATRAEVATILQRFIANVAAAR